MLRGIGAPPEVIEEAGRQLEASAQPSEPMFDVWDENWESVAFFCKLDTQWQRMPIVMSQQAGIATNVFTRLRRECLPADRVESSARLHGIPRSRWPRLFADVQLMEREVLKIDQEQRMREG